MTENQGPIWGESRPAVPQFPRDSKNSVSNSIKPKSSEAHGLGVASIISGGIAIAIGWIPFIGFIALPISAIALVLGVIGFIFPLATKKSGLKMPIIGLVISLASLALPFLTTSALINEIDTPEFREAMADIGESFEEMSSEDNLAVMSQTEISNLQVGRTDSGEPQISFEIKNNSERNLKYVRVDCEFFGKEGQAVYKTEFTPVSHWGAPAGSVEFLGSGETWFTEDNEFFKIKKSDLEEWDSVTVEVKIGSIEID
ncbi:MAG: hypothetical protein VYB42_03125 [Verrucomicrobiota bacterium]|nr:hypothetical protein [Verrucomicrobiota bacterium]